jgi:hypothetical protein
LSSFGVVQRTTFHLSTRLDTKLDKMSTSLAVGANDPGARLALSGEGSGGSVSALLFPMPDEVFFLVN